MQHHRASLQSHLRRGRARQWRARAPRVLIVTALFGAVACEVPPETTAYAHESPPSWDASDAPIDGPSMATFRFGTYLGGGGNDEITAVTATGSNYPHVIVAGGTGSSDFSTTNGSQVDMTTPAGCSACPSDAFVTKLRGPGEVVWSTVVGGPGFERAAAVATASDGDVFVAGSAASLPATSGAADATFAGGSTAERGGEDGFVCRLDGATGATEWCTFVGGNGSGGVQAIVADWSDDSVLVALGTAAAESLDGDAAYNAAFAGRHRSSPGGVDTVVVRVAGNGQSFVAATYIGGTGDESGAPSLALGSDVIHVLTTTSSTDAPTPGGRITTAPAGRNAYFATLSRDAMTLRYGTYLGGAGDDWTAPGSLYSAGGVYVAVNTASTDMPIVQGVQPTYGGGGSNGCGDGDGWIAWMHPTLTGNDSLVFATYLGGSRGDEIGGLTRIPGNNDLVVTGRTYSSDFPLSQITVPYQSAIAGSPCTTTPGNSDGFLVRLSASLRERNLATYHGGSAADSFVTVAAPGDTGFFVFAGSSMSNDFPTRASIQNTLRGPSDGVLVVTVPWLAPGSMVDAGPGPSPDAAPDALGSVDAGNGIDEGGGGCCGAGGGGASSSAMALIVLALVMARVRATSRGRRARAGTA